MERNILQKIQSSTAGLTKAQSQVAEYIHQNPVEASFQTLDQIAASIGTSTTTVMRFAFSLGFSGYSELQKELQNLIRSKLTPESRMTQHIESLDERSLLARCAEKQIDNIQKTRELLADEDIAQAIRLLKKARRVYLLGTRTSFTVSYFLYQVLSQQLGNCELLAATGQDIAKLAAITADDALLVVSLPRYARSAIETVKVIRQKRHPSVITITDGFAAPLAPHSDVILPCEYDSLSFHNSMAAPLYIAELLATGLAQATKKETSKKLAGVEEIMTALDFHYE